MSYQAEKGVQTALKIGILGGTFDPLHQGHIALAEQVLEALHLDKVLFTPTFRPVFKQGQQVSSAESRVQALQTAITPYPRFEVSLVDIERAQKAAQNNAQNNAQSDAKSDVSTDTYSIDTVADIAAQYPSAELYFIAGADILPQLHRWKSIAELLERVKFCVVSRPGYALTPNSHLAKYADRFIYMDLDTPNISSSAMRAGVVQYKYDNFDRPEC